MKAEASKPASTTVATTPVPADQGAPALTAGAEKGTSHLKMPAEFDAQTVRQLLSTVGAGRNATILKVGYFFRRGNPTLPVAHGYEMLKTNLAAEPEGTKRWFLLQNLRGWAGFRVPDVPSQDAYEAYDALFAQASKAKAAGAHYALATAIVDYVAAVPGRMRSLGLQRSDRTKEVLAKAWVAYYGFVRDGKSAGSPPLWEDAVFESNAQREFLPLVEQAMVDPAIPKTFSLLMSAAALLRATQPERALNLLQQAKALLPGNEPELASKLYDQLIDLVLETSDSKPAEAKASALEQAIALQRERIGLTSRGRARLIQLLDRQKNAPAMEVVLTELKTPTAAEREINDSAEMLWSLYFKRKDIALLDPPISLLTNYLETPREKNIEQCLRSRVTLGGMFIAQSKWQQALYALKHEATNNPDGKPAGLTPAAKRYIKALADMTRLATSKLDAQTKYEKAPEY